jgi:hypothetical protein
MCTLGDPKVIVLVFKEILVLEEAVLEVVVFEDIFAIG